MKTAVRQIVLALLTVLFALNASAVIPSIRTPTSGTLQVFEAGTAYWAQSDKIDDTHFLVTWKSGGSASAMPIHARIGEIDPATQTITYGPVKVVETANNSKVEVVALSATQAVVSFELDLLADIGQARLIEFDLSTDTITTVNAAVTYNNEDINFASLERLSDTSLVIACRTGDGSSAPYAGSAFVGSVSGSTLSFGSAQNYSATQVDSCDVKLVSPGRILVAFEFEGGSMDPGKVIVGDISGNSISWGTAATFTAHTREPAIAVIDETTFFVGSGDDADSDHGKGYVGTITGNSITFGSGHTFETAQDVRDLSATHIQGNEFMIAYNGFSDPSSYFIGEVNGTAITFGAEQQFLDSQADDAITLRMDDNTCVITAINDAHSDTGFAFVVTLSPPVNSTPPLSVSISSSSNISVNGGSDGSITASVSGGTPNYDYAWSNGSSTSNTSSTNNMISSLSAGAYTVTVTDSLGATNSASVTLTEPAPDLVYVDVSRFDDSGTGTSWATAKKTIQAAISTVTSTGTVWVTNGTYNLSSPISLTQAITVQSVNGPESTIIHGGGSVRCVYQTAGSLNGFTLTNGSATDGGGAYLTGGSLNNSILSGNTATASGGGAYLTGGSLNNSILSGNSAGTFGGGAYLFGGKLNNCTVSENSCNLGGGVFVVSSGTLNNCIVWGNSGSMTANLNQAGGTVRYTCAPEAGTANGCITVNPKLTADLHLQTNSPCLHTGSNTYAPAGTDLDGNPRVAFGTVDMGAYEFQYSLSTDNGASAGGNTVTITIDNSATDITNVTVGGVSATITGQTTNSVTITLPAGTDGTADIAIESTSRDTTTLAGVYTYIPMSIVQPGPLAVTMSEDSSPRAWVAPALSATNYGTLAWSIATDASQGTATVSGAGASPSTFTYVPDADFSGTDSFEVQVEDASGTKTIAVNVTIEPENDAPVIVKSGYAPVDTIGWWGITDGASGIDIAPSGEIYCLVEEYNLIHVWNADGSYQRTWGSFGSGDGQFNAPLDLAVGTNGQVYVSDKGNDRVQVFASSGVYIAQFGEFGSGDGQFDNPRGIAVDDGGNVYVVDGSNDRIQVFDSEGTYLRQWSAGSSPRDIIIAGTRAYVTDSDLPGIICYDLNGSELTRWGNSGTGTGQFDSPRGISVDGNGNVYVADRDNKRIQKFDADGVYLSEWGTSGSAPGEFDDPYEMAISASDEIYVVDQGNDRIQIFNTSGQFQGSLGDIDSRGGPELNNPYCVVHDRWGNIYVSDYSKDSILRYDMNGEYLGSWGEGELTDPYGMSFDTNGHLYVADYDNYLIQVFDEEGRYLREWWVVNPRDVLVHSNGLVYVSGDYEDEILVFDSVGNEINRWGEEGSGNGQFINPYGLAADSNGDIYVVDSDNDRVQVFDPDGNYLRQWGSAGSGQGELQEPRFLSIDVEDRVFVADKDNNRIQYFTTNGVWLGKIGDTEGTSLGQFDGPSAVSFDPSGTLFVCDASNDRITRIGIEPWDKVTMSEDGSPIPFSLRAVANDVDGEMPIWRVHTQGGHGTVSLPTPLNRNVMDVNYVPAADWNGVDTFILEARDQFGATDTIEIEVTVLPMHEPVEILGTNSLSITMSEDGLPMAWDLPALTTTNGTASLIWSVVSQGSNGTAFVSSDGTVTFIPALDYSGTDQFIIKVSDGIFADTVTVNVTVETQNDTPLISLPEDLFGSSEMYLEDPRGVAVGISNQVYISDHRTDAIYQWNADGEFIRKWGEEGSGEGQFSDPHDIAIGTNGNVYVMDLWNYRIQVFSSDGLYLDQWGEEGSGDGQFNYPRGIATDANGNVYVADQGNSRIQVFDADGTYLRQWLAGRLPHDIAIHGSNAYVVDGGDHDVPYEVIQFGLTGNEQRRWGVEGSGNGAFSKPRGIAVDASGTVYVADMKNHRVQLFSSNGVFQTSWGTNGVAPGQFKDPHDIAISASGDVYVVDLSNDRVQLFNTAGEYQRSLGNQDHHGGPAMDEPKFVVFDEQGRMYVSDYGDDVIFRYDADGTYLGTWGFGDIDGSEGMAFDANGILYVADSYDEYIHKIDTNGTYLGRFGGYGSADDKLDNPTGIAIHSNLIYIVDEGQDRIKVMTLDGTFVRKFGERGSGPGQLADPAGIAVDDNGDIYVTEGYNKRVQVFDNAGNYLRHWGEDGTGDGEFQRPCGIVIGPDGLVYVSQRLNGRAFQVFDKNGRFVRKIDQNDSSYFPLNYGGGIAFHPDGNLVVCESNGDERVVVVPWNDLDRLERTMSEDGSPAAFREIQLFGRDVEHHILGWSIFSQGNHGTASFIGATDTNLVTVTYAPDEHWNGTDSFFVALYDELGATNTIEIVVTVDPVIDPASVTLSNLLQAVDGTTRNVSATTDPSGLTVNFTYNGSTNAPVNVGSYSIVGTIDDSVYIGSTTGTLVVVKGNQVIDFPTIGNPSITNTVGLSATATSGMEVSFSVASGPASISDGTNLAFNASGMVAVVATQGGNGNWNAAPAVTNTFEVTSVSFGSGPAGGGNTLTLSGMTFGNGSDITNVTVSGVSATIVDQGTDWVSIVIPAGAEGSKNIVIESTSQGSTTLTGAYTYVSMSIVQSGPLAVTMSEDGNPTAWAAPTLSATNFGASTWSLVTDASHGTATVSGTGASPSTFIYVPDADFSGTDSFEVQVEDSSGTNTITVNVTVAPENDAPVIVMSGYAPVDTLGWWGITDGARGISVSSSGTVYCVVTEYNLVHSWDADGNYLRTFGSYGSGDGQFNEPHDVAVGTNGQVYVVDQSNNRVQVFSADGVYAGQFGEYGSDDGEFDAPRGIAVDAAANVYVVDGSNDRVQVFDSNGAYLRQWAAGSTPRDIAIRKERVYVTDSGNDEVLCFDLAGNDLTRWGSYGSADGELDSPRGIAVDGFGQVYVADKNNDRIQVFSTNGTYLTQWGSYGEEYGEFDVPYDLAVSPAGTLYVVDQDNDRIQLFTNGIFQSSLGDWDSRGGPELNNPYCVVHDRWGNIYVSDYSKDSILRYDMNGEYLGSWGKYGWDEGEFTDPYGMSFDTNDHFYVADSENSRIQVLDEEGRYLREWWVWNPRDVLVHSNGLVYVSSYSGDAIVVYDSVGNEINRWGEEGSGNRQFDNPCGLATDSNGDVYVVDTDNDRIQVFDPDGTYLREWGEEGSGDGEFNEPRFLTIDAEDRVFVADKDNNRIQYFTTNGVWLGHIGNTEGTSLGQFDGPSAVSFDPSGILFVCDASNDRITRIGTEPWDKVTMSEDGSPIPFSLRVVANDVDGEMPTWRVHTQGGHGTVSLPTPLNRNVMDVDYVPEANWNGIDTFILEARDQFGATDTIEIEVTVLPMHEPVEILGTNSLSVTMSEDGLPTAWNLPTLTTTNGTASLIWSVVSQGSNGTAFVSSDGTVTFVPAPDYNGTDSFIIKVSDGIFADTVTVNVTVKSRNDTPLISLPEDLFGSSEMYLEDPRGVAIGISNQVYISDHRTDAIYQWNADGGFVRKWGEAGSGDGQFSNPHDMAVDTNGNVYVVDEDNARVQVFNAEGMYQSQFGSSGAGNGQFNEPRGIAIDGDGNVYVVDMGNSRVQVFTSGGIYLRQQNVGNYPHDIAIHGTNVYVVDGGQWNDIYEVIQYDLSGNELGRWGSYGTADGQFEMPRGIAVDASGNVYVADMKNHRIQRFSSNGVFQTSWGTNGIAPGQFKEPHDLAISASGDIYVIDQKNDRVQLFNTAGEYQRSFGNQDHHGGPAMDEPQFVIFDKQGRMYVGDYADDVIYRYDVDGSYLDTWGYGDIEQPKGMAFDSAGILYVADYYDEYIHKIDTNGTYLGRFGGYGREDGELYDPTGVAIYNDQLYVVGREERVQVFELDGTFVRKFGEQGSGLGQLNDPSGLAVDDNGDIYVADTSNNRIQVFDNNGNYLRHWGGDGTEDGQFSRAFGIIIGPDGLVYVSEHLNPYDIQVFDKNGRFIRRIGQDDSSYLPLDYGAGMAFSPDGNLVVCEASGDERVIVIPWNDLDRLDRTMSEDGSPDAFKPIQLFGRDVEHHILGWNIQTQGDHGTASFIGATDTNLVTVTYAPEEHWNGTDSFFVALFDEQGATNTIEIVVTVDPIVDPASVTLTNLLQAVDGTARKASAMTDPVGLTINFTYNGSTNAPVNIGSYTVIGTVSDPVYTGSATGTLVVIKGNQTIDFPTIGNQITTNVVQLSATTSSGIALFFDVVDGPATLTTNGIVRFTTSGTVTLRAFNGGNSNWNPASTNISFDVAKAVASVSLSPTNQTYNGTARTVTATTVPSGQAVDITYDGSTNAPTNANSYTVVAIVNEAMYQGGATGTLTVAKAGQTIDFPAIGNRLAPDTVGLSAIASSGLDVSFGTFSPGSISGGTNLSFSGAGAVNVVATQSGTGNWNAASVTNTFTVSKATPSVTAWPTASAITYGQTLANSPLSGGSASVAGGFVFTTPATSPAAGTATQDLTFLPTDSARYNSVAGSASVMVNKKILIVSGASATDKIYDGTTAATISGSSLVGVVSGDNVTLSNTVSGVFAQAPAGTNIIVTSSMTLRGTDASNYSLSQPTLSADITAKGLTVSGASANDKIYDATTTATISGGSLVGIVSGDVVALTNTTSGLFAQETIGTNIAVTSSMTLSGFDSVNYSIAQPTLSADITAKGLTVSGASATDKTYDATTAAAITGGSLVGTVSGDTVTLTNASAGVFAQATIGTNIAVTSSMTLCGADASNYTVAQPTLSADITAKGLTVSGASANDKTYDGTTATTISGGSLVGVVIDDDVTLSNTVSGVFAQANAGTNITVTSAMTLGGMDAGNYTLSQPALSADISKKDQTIRFGSIGTQAVTNTVVLSVSATSDLTVGFSMVSGPGSISSGTNLSFNSAGRVIITASQSGNENWTAAPTVTNSFDVMGVITNVSPNSGTVFGGTEVIIDGLWLSNGGDITNVTLCGIAANVVSQGIHSVSVLSGIAPPVQTNGDVIIQSGFGTVVLTNGYTYRPVPLAPTALSAVDITDSQFTARWIGNDETATHYFIDVAETTNFTAMTGVYSNYNIGNATAGLVTGLVDGVDYWYRVRAASQHGPSLNSNLIEVPVSTNTPYVKQEITNGVASAGSSDVIDLGDMFHGTGKSYEVLLPITDTNGVIVAHSIDAANGVLTLSYASGKSGYAIITVREWTEPNYTGFYVDNDITVYVTDAQPTWSVGPVELNLANGLFEQIVSVTNASDYDADAVTLTVSNITEGATLYNATGIDPMGNSEIHWIGSLVAGAGMDFTLQYFKPMLGTAPIGTVSVSLSLERPDVELDEENEINLTAQLNRGSLFVIGFKAEIGKTYYVQYKDSMDSTDWKTAYPPITALTKQVQWVDSGPPVTEPAGSSRFYRVIQAD